jgi:membrane-associated phospholipid phosphatase
MIKMYNIIKQFFPGCSRLAFLLLSIWIAGCGTMRNGHRWADDATLFPGWKRLGRAAVHAAASPYTWLPAGGAVAMQFGHLDKHISNWAINHTPLFGSQQRAYTASNNLSTTTDIILCISILVTPSGNDPLPWVIAKAKGCAVDLAALTITDGTVTLLKKSTGRHRPNGSDNLSFPSGHASMTSLNSTLAYGNLQYLHLPAAAQTVLGTGMTSLPLLCSWARMEAGAHYPSDVLAGLALGHFFGVFFQDAFLEIDNTEFLIDMASVHSGLTLGFTWRF